MRVSFVPVAGSTTTKALPSLTVLRYASFPDASQTGASMASTVLPANRACRPAARW